MMRYICPECRRDDAGFTVTRECSVFTTANGLSFWDDDDMNDDALITRIECLYCGHESEDVESFRVKEEVE